MTSRGQIWKCSVCGNVIEVLHEGADALVCCGVSMGLISEKAEEEGRGKHVPVVEGNKVEVGSVAHPMEAEHYIEWIEGVGDDGVSCKKFLKAGDLPAVEFTFDVVSARAYCNVHGLWKS